MRSLPIYGKGVSFPFRIDPATGRVAVSSGSSDGSSVALAYLNEEAWTIREEITAEQNLIAEAIAHILLTRQTEHDTLPQFGSDINAFLFDSNSFETKYLLDVYFKQAALRWEKRAFVADDAITFPDRLDRAAYGEMPVSVAISFAQKQPQGNLVAPFASTNQARLAEYPSAELDISKHDYYSRYYNNPINTDGTVRFNLPITRKPIPPAIDDYIVKVKYEQNWLDIAWAEYQDIRYWWIPADCYVYDAADQGLSWDVMYPAYELEMGASLRLPSIIRVQNEIAIDKYSG